MWPVLDGAALYGFAGRFVRAAIKNSEADPAAVLITFLTRFGIECGNLPVFLIGDTEHYARLFAVVVGASSKARKGTSGGPVRRLYDFGKFWHPDSLLVQAARHSNGPLSSGEGIIDAVHDEKGVWQIDKRTGEKVWTIIEPDIEDKRLFVFDEELGSALAAMDRNGNTLSTILRCAWDHGNLEPLTKNNKSKATGAHIGIVTHITLWELHKKLDKTEAFSGFANRFLWCCSKRQTIVPLPKPMSQAEICELQADLIDILKISKSFKRMKFGDSAKAIWTKVYPGISKDNQGLVGAIINRAEAQVIRLSMIYALLDSQNTIEEKHLIAALSMWKYCEDSARFIFSGREMNHFALRIKEILKAEGPRSATEIYRGFNGHITKDQFDTAITELVSRDEIVQEDMKTGGRPKRIFRLCVDN